ncbi:MAG: 30S ribosomal protein S8 [archaeon]
MRHDLLADAMSAIKNAERMGMHELKVPSSNLLKDVLGVFKKEGYIEDYSSEGAYSLKVKLAKKITDCGVIKPRYSINKNTYTKWEKRYLPSRDFGILVLSTPKGVMTHREAKDKNQGGVLLSFVY